MLWCGLALGLVLATKYIFIPAVIAIIVAVILLSMGEGFWQSIKKLGKPSLWVIYACFAAIFYAFLLLLKWVVGLNVAIPFLDPMYLTAGNVMVTVLVFVLPFFISVVLLEKILPLVERKRFEPKQTLFSEGDTAETFYMLVRGKVLLQQVISEKAAVSMDVIKPGFSFGWSAMLSGGMEPVGRYTSNAVCMEPCECFVIDGDAFKALLDADHAMGYLVSQRIIRIIKKRLVYRNRQFARIIEKNPDLQDG